MKRRVIAIVVALSLGVALTGCAVETVTKAQLEEARARWQEPKVSIWYYTGSEDGYHYYTHYDTPGTRRYRISEKEWVQKDPFPRTWNQKKWRVMSWGVHALMNQRGKAE